jgi:signal transduction histidine kinase
MRESAQNARCDVELTAMGPVRGCWDRLRLEQILTNLLSNAFKHAAGSRVVVSVQTELDRAKVEVRDSGPGVPDAALPRLFGRFERGSSFSHGGLGLGLYVAHQAALAHGGSLSVANPAGGGASFVVTLPLAPVAQAG